MRMALTLDKADLDSHEAASDRLMAFLRLALHSDPELIEIPTLVMGHSLVRSLVCSHRSLTRLLRTVRFARALRCAHLFARSLTHLLLSSWDSAIFLSSFQGVLNHCANRENREQHSLSAKTSSYCWTTGKNNFTFIIALSAWFVLLMQLTACEQTKKRDVCVYAEWFSCLRPKLR